MKDYSVYIDTDSIYVGIEQWIKDNTSMHKWNNLDKSQKIDYINRISKVIEEEVNVRSFNEVQKIHYNSQDTDFKINFEQEKIIQAGLFSTKKRYALWTLLDGSKPKNDVSVTGLEVIRSDSPEIVKPMVKKILKMILNDDTDSHIRKYIRECKKKLNNCLPSDIAENKGINNITKYVTKDNVCKKGTPHQVKGVAAYRKLIDLLKIQGKYEDIQNGNKGKVVYLMKNKFNFNSLTFITWCKEFDKVIRVDFQKMIQNNFTKKVEKLLLLVNRQHLLYSNTNLF
jgi:DNA polymerase elongation subunit (family B)